MHRRIRLVLVSVAALVATLFIGVNQASAAAYTLGTTHSSCVFSVSRVYVGSTLMLHLTRITAYNKSSITHKVACTVTYGGSVVGSIAPVMPGNSSTTFGYNSYRSSLRLSYDDRYFDEIRTLPLYA